MGRSNTGRSSLGRGLNQNRRRGSRGRQGASRGTTSSGSRSTGQQQQAAPKTLADYMCNNAGSARNASEHVLTTKFLLNHLTIDLDEGDDVVKALEDYKEFDFDTIKPTLQASVNPDAEAKKIKDRQFEMEFNAALRTVNDRRNLYRKNKSKTAGILWKQCAEKMKAKLQARKDFAAIERDPIKLLKAIKQHALSYETTQYRMKTVLDTLRNFIGVRLKDDKTIIDYLKRSKAAEEVFYSHVGNDFAFPRMLREEQDFKKICTRQRDAIEAKFTGCTVHRKELF